MTITYKFSDDCQIHQLRGKTVTGGVFCRVDGKCIGEFDAVRFFEQIEGNTVMARIAGKPELEAALAAHRAAQKSKQDRLAAIGWSEYKAIQSTAVNACAAYDHASEHGYPAKEAAALRAADEALEQARIEYPQAAAYAKAEAYWMAANDQKSSAGRTAMSEIEDGADPIAAVEKMAQVWGDAAKKSVDNS